MSTGRGMKHPQRVPRGEKMILQQGEDCLRDGKVGKTGEAELMDQTLRDTGPEKGSF